MDFSDIINDIWKEIIIGILTFIIGYSWGKWKGFKSWNKKQFKDKINISLNTITPQDKNTYSLKLRTLMEKNLNEIIQNEQVKTLILKAIKNTNPGQPLLIFEEKDAWYILNTILNQISNQFSNGLMKKDLGFEVKSDWYIFCLTFEREENVLMQKIRVQLIKRKMLEEFPDENSNFILESFNHDTRVETLRTLQKELKEHPYCFMDIEISQ